MTGLSTVMEMARPVIVPDGPAQLCDALADGLPVWHILWLNDVSSRFFDSAWRVCRERAGFPAAGWRAGIGSGRPVILAPAHGGRRSQ